MIKVITYGTYDMLHIGHINILSRAKAQGDYLVVGITSEDYDRSRGKLNVSQSDKQRLEAASFYLKKQLTKQEQEAVLKAHNIWIDRDWAWIYNYTQTEILEKSKILKEAWFSKEERRVLLEKGVCGKEKWIDEDLIIKELKNRKERKEYYIKIDRLWLTEDFIKSIDKSWLWWSEKMTVIERYERLNKQIEEYFNKQQKWEINSWEYINFKNFNDFINKRLKEINIHIKNWPKLTKTEANLIFSLTDNYIFNNLNIFLWKKWDKYNKLIKSLSKKEINWVEKLVKDIDIALNKMPDLKPWKDWFIFRWDKLEFWRNEEWKILEIGESNELRIFSFCANNIDDSFIWKFDKDIAVYIHWKKWKIKNISKLSMWVNFWWRVIKQIDRTNNEWIILRNSKLHIYNKKTVKNISEFYTKQIK